MPAAISLGFISFTPIYLAEHLSCAGMSCGGGFRDPVARAEYRSPTGSIQASPCLSPRRVVCARRVGERPVGRGTEEEVAHSGVSFFLVTFFWTSKKKLPAVGQPPTSSFSLSPEAIRQKRGAGAEPPAISVSTRARSARYIESRGSRHLQVCVAAGDTNEKPPKGRLCSSSPGPRLSPG